MNWELADRVKMRLKPGMRVYAYQRVKGKRKKVDSYSVTRDTGLIAPEFETFLAQLEPSEVEVRDSNGYVTSCRLSCEREETEDSWTEDVDAETLGVVMAILDGEGTPKQKIGQLLSMYAANQQKGKET